MSYGGDPNIILAALREIVFNENATVEVATGTLLKGGQEDAVFVKIKDETKNKNENENETKVETEPEAEVEAEAEAKPESETVEATSEEKDDNNESKKNTETEKKSEPSPLDKYFLRPKEWEKWVPENVDTEIDIGETLKGTALDSS